MNNKVTKSICTNNIKDTVKEVVDELGGFGKFIKPGDRVLIKNNLNTADAAPASTPVDIIQAVVELAFEAKAKKVIIGDSSTLTIGNHAKFVSDNFDKAGINELKYLKNAPDIMVFDETGWTKKKIPQGKYIKSVSLAKIMDNIDKIILLPTCKTHFIAEFTGALKLVIGMVKPSERIKFHMGHVSEKIAEINTLYQPTLVIMDARKCFISGGPVKGEVREPKLVLASESRVNIDIEEIKIIQQYEGNTLKGKSPAEFTQIKKAKELGIS